MPRNEGRCCRPKCKSPVFGQQQVCDGCREKDLLCQAKGCGNPHGGQAGTTKLCPPCRAKKRGGGRPRVQPLWNPREDAILRDVYAKHHGKRGSDGALAKLCALLPHRPRGAFQRRAAAIGATTVRTKELPWSAEEDAILQSVGWMSPERIVMHLKKAGFARTVTAVAIRAKRRRVREHIDGVSGQGLAQLLGIDVHAVTRWIARGWLKASRRADAGGAHDKHYIANEAIRAFFLGYPEQVELGKLERVGSKMWFLEQITGGRISEHGEAVPRATAAGATPADADATPDRTVPLYGERVTLTALAEICGRSVAALLHRIDGLGMAVEGAAFGEDELDEATASVPSPTGRAIRDQLRALMKRHRATPADLVAWTGLPASVVERLVEGALPMMSPALLSVVDKLDGEVGISITPKARAYEMPPAPEARR